MVSDSLLLSQAILTARGAKLIRHQGGLQVSRPKYNVPDEHALWSDPKNKITITFK